MDALALVAGSLSLVNYGLAVSYKAVVYILVGDATSQYSRSRFGRLGRLAQTLGILDTAAVRSAHWNINMWSDDEVLSWKASYISSCSAIAVAGAIFASIGLTALQLPGIAEVNWTARALLSSSMAVGILSVFCATQQQQEIAMINTPLEVRLWLSRGKADLEDKFYHENRQYALLPLQSSASIQKTIGLPRTLLAIAMILYLVGFGLYLLLQWLEQVPAVDTGLRSIFIVFTTTMAAFCLYKFLLLTWNLIDIRRRTEHFKLKEDYIIKATDGAELKQCLEHVQAYKQFIDLTVVGDGKEVQSPSLPPEQQLLLYQTLKNLDDILTKWNLEQHSSGHYGQRETVLQKFLGRNLYAAMRDIPMDP